MIFDQQSVKNNKRLPKPCHLYELEKYLNLDAFFRQITRVVPDFNSTKSSNYEISSSSSSSASPNPSVADEPSPNEEPAPTPVTQINNAPTINPPTDLYSDEFMIDNVKKCNEDSILNTIVYDTTLPDTILQDEQSCESSDMQTPSVSDEINFSNQLSDDTFNTEGSRGSLLSQCASQPDQCVSEPTTLTQIKCVTAPTTPIGSRPNSPSLTPSYSKTKKCVKNKSSISREVNMTVKRRKVWIMIARKEIPRAQRKQTSSRKKLLATCRKISRMATNK
ncbi:putative uncharacterized protein DDB_G0290521 [Tetranychus urticae]|uniref:Uncharacterized protein n=1 Tax=Tetranychus urticae TaxID=32264 RepID=T1KXM6_TETUR|nr:putative uncharacterized protein DDB_G0290521 [Tetranychus urticae]